MHATLQHIRNAVEQGSGRLVDVREEDEWHRGHLAGAFHAPLSQLEAGHLDALPSEGVLYLYCRRANRVKRALPLLAQRKQDVELIPFGFEDLWAAGFPVADFVPQKRESIV